MESDDRPTPSSSAAFTAGEPTGSALPENPWPSAIAIMLATMMVYLDTTVVNLSLPHMAGSLSASIHEATWSLTSYLAANAVILPLTGWLANWIGRKRLIMGALTGFVAASLGCGVSSSIGMLIVFRVIQGLTGGVMQPISQAVLLESFPADQRGKAMGVWSMGIVLAPILGPVIGGWLTENWNWRWVFLINVPVGLLSLLLVRQTIVDPSYIKRQTERIDWAGIGLVTLGIACIQIMLDQGQDEDWFNSRFVVGLLAVGVVSLVIFVVRSLRSEYPVLDLRDLWIRTFAIGTAFSGLVGYLLHGSIVVLPLLLQTQLGFPPLEAGLAIVPRGIGAFLAFPLVGVIADRFDPRKLLFAGLVLGSFTMFWFATLDHSLGYWDLVAPQFIQGLALGLLFVPLSTITMDPISRPRMGNATSVYNVVRNLGSSIGIAIVATQLTRGQLRHQAHLIEGITAYDPATRLRLESLEQLWKEAGVDPATAALGARAALGRLVDQQAGILAYLDSFRLFGLVFLLMCPFVFLMERPRHLRR